ncbi:MAG: FliI/YscN family ATPase [Chloroflexi bacterium]|nr:FliI/YscN family ATPase [Chloroflexota bacterium]
MTRRISLAAYRRLAEETPVVRPRGRVTQVVGLTVEAEGITPHIGEMCDIAPRRSARWVPAEVVGFKESRCVLMPLTEPLGITLGDPVFPTERPFTVPVGPGLLGRILDGYGRPIDGKGPLENPDSRPLESAAPNPLKRTRILQPLSTGVRAIDGLLTCGHGQRIGIFAGSGVGKSTLLGMITRQARNDVYVVALIGERGREVQEFIRSELGDAGLHRSVVVVATSDRPALERRKGAWVASAIAEYFRDQGLNVGLVMDSLTRFAMAQREIGLAAGEPPTTKGYPPSVFSLLAKLLERAGTAETGSISGFYTVLVEADDLTEPITDTVRSVLDGHIYLSRELAHEDHYPAVDVLGSISRVMAQVTSESHRRHAGRFKRLMAAYRNARDLINIGAYVPGSNPEIDHALELMPRMRQFLQQRPQEHSTLEEAIQQLADLVEDGQRDRGDGFPA